MTLRRFFPRTLAGQLLALLFAVLIIAQAINLALLVGSQRIQARSTAYTTAIEFTASLIAQLPEKTPTELPYFIPMQRGQPLGSFFLSTNNFAERDESGTPEAEQNWINLPRYNSRFQTLLNDKGITPLQTAMSFMPLSPSAQPKDMSQDQRPNGPRPQGGPPPEDDAGRRGAPPDGGPGGFGPPSDNALRSRPPPPLPAGGLGGPQDLQEIRLSAEIKPGIWFNALMPHAETESLTGRISLATTLLLGLSLLAVWFFARRLSRPISEFARAAEQLGRGEEPDRLAETGPVDMKLAASAFNNMQSRVTRMLETQRMMLRAVGHDLRTPLTTLRLRAENIEDDIEREKVIGTINDMTVMTEEILSWAKDASGTEELASVDLKSLLESLTDDYKDQGDDVSLKDFAPFAIKIRRISIKRALQNVINNALKFGNCAMISVEQLDKMVLIYIEDTGPGVTEEQQEEILKPFVRLETSRSKETGGTGLGLSITNSIIQIHGGTLTLSNRQRGGLRVTITLPV